MLNEIKLPSMGATMEEGKIVAWHVKEGDRVAPGDILLEIETDKSVFEVESPCDGTVRKVLAPEGESLPVQTVIALVGEPGEAIPAHYLSGAVRPPVRAVAEGATPRVVPLVHAAAGCAAGESKISPRARKLAEQLGVDIRGIAGSGPGGRIESADIERAARNANGASGHAPSATVAALAVTGSTKEGAGEVMPFDAARLQINRKVTHSKREIPHFYIGVLIDATRLVAFREKQAAAGRSISINAVLMKAIAKALEAEPSLNVEIREHGYVRRTSVDVGLAVDTPKGVMIAVMASVDKQDAVGLSNQIRDTVGKVRRGETRDVRLSGACMTISNVGMYRSDLFIPIIHPGETAILGVGSLADRAIVASGQVKAVPTLPVTLCVDHRIVDGAAAARFLQALAAYLEQVE